LNFLQIRQIGVLFSQIRAKFPLSPSLFLDLIMKGKYAVKPQDVEPLQHIKDESAISIEGLTTKAIIKNQDLSSLGAHRKVSFGIAVDPPPTFLTNSIRTSRYTLITWAPKSLLMQFRKSANVYFLAISVLTMMSFSPKNPFSMILTFAAVLVFTMLKEAYEDYFRHVQDQKVNNCPTHAFDPVTRNFVDVHWKDVKVGNILEIKEGESFPADMVFLSSSNMQGTAFVNTMNLDGETNLKEKMALELTKDMRELDLHAILLEVATDTPNMSLLRWNCNIRMNGSIWQPMTLNQLLLRGCQLKNTRRLYGFVIYTGHETKIMQNSMQPKSKMSSVLKKMNKMLWTIYVMQFVICTSFAGLSIYWQNVFESTHLYLEINDKASGGNFVIQVLTFYVAYSHLIPISLYVALEVVKLVCSYLIGQDLGMFYEPDDRPASARTSDLVEELGQVEFVFSDKTGTLTQNIMKFKKCSVNGIVYGNKEGIGKNSDQDSRPLDVLEQSSMSDPDRVALTRFFVHMSLCHTVFPTSTGGKGRLPTYQASSPDELALVQGAAQAGFVFFDKSMNTLYAKTYGSAEKLAWEVLAEIPFNSNRKRMSVVLKELRSSNYLLLCKGADQVIFPLMRSDQALRSLVEDHLHLFAMEGLRTLVMCQRSIAPEEFLHWHKRWQEVQLSNTTDKELKLDLLGAELENNMELVGASAIEDKLQEGVPETIALLIEAGIRVWVLTGDKQETAVEIGKACNLITQDTKLLDLSSASKSDLLAKLETYNAQYVRFT